ncbi:MAG: hypothetical protein ABJD24_16865 [Acidimicrobiales bacterium]
MGKPTARVWFGVIIAAAGATLLFLGWYGISGESSVAEQVPYLASASIPGAALLIVGATLAAREREGQNAERMVSTLYELLTEPVTDAPATAPTDDRLVALPDATKYHQVSCVLVAGKDDAVTVDSHDIAARGLEPCPLCTVGQPAG